MKIIVSADGEDLKANVHETFGRCDYFVIVEVEEDKIILSRALENKCTGRAGGVGISAAQLVAEEGADIVICQKIGPRAIDVLSQLSIDVYLGKGTVEEAVSAYLGGGLKKIDAE